MATPTANTAKFGFEVKNLDAELRVAAFRGQEGMSQLFQFELDLVSDDPEIDFAGVVNQEAVITIEGQDETRYVHGIVQRFEQGDQGHRLTHYHALLVPKLWWLEKRRDCRIFQDKNVQDIIEEVLKGANLTQEDYNISLDQSYPKREYCVQYRETDLAFIERLMAEEGIFYYFKHDDQKHTLVIGDSTSAYGVIPGNDTVPFVPPTGNVSDKEHASKFRYAEGVSSGEVVLRDFNFKKPGSNLEVAKGDDKFADLAVYDYPGNYEEPDRGKTVRQIRMEELMVERKRASGTTACPRLIPGHKFTLDKHPRSSFNQGYLIATLVHEGKEPQALEEESANEGAHYSNNFMCIPIDVVYRSGNKGHKPRVDGPQTAIVVGPNGEEIYTDEFGRVKVKFHWDRLGKGDENSSCWVRVSQAWAGAGWGTLLIPRIGHEVIVDFLEGDPDHPVITGRIYHGTNRPPYKLPDEKTKSTLKSNSSKGGGGFNEIRLEDKKDNEEIYIHAQKDMKEEIGNDHEITVGGERTDTIKGDFTQTVTDGNMEVSVEKGNIEVTADKGNIEVSADTGSIDMTASTGVEITTTTGTLELKAGTAAVNGKIEIDSTTGEISLDSTTNGVSVNAPLGLEVHTGDFFEKAVSKKEMLGVKWEMVGFVSEQIVAKFEYVGVAIAHEMLKIDLGGFVLEQKPVVIKEWGVTVKEKEAEVENSELTLKQALLHLFL